MKDLSLQIFASYLQFCGIGLRNAQLYEKSLLEVKRNQVLLDLARMIFEEQSTIEQMVLRILTHMQSLIQCQRVQVSAHIFTRPWLSESCDELTFDLTVATSRDPNSIGPFTMTSALNSHFRFTNFHRFYWYTSRRKEASQGYSISKRMTSTKMKTMPELVHSSRDSPST